MICFDLSYYKDTKFAFLVSKEVVVVDVGGIYVNDDDGKEEEEGNCSESNSETVKITSS